MGYKAITGPIVCARPPAPSSARAWLWYRSFSLASTPQTPVEFPPGATNDFQRNGFPIRRKGLVTPSASPPGRIVVARQRASYQRVASASWKLTNGTALAMQYVVVDVAGYLRGGSRPSFRGRIEFSGSKHDGPIQSNFAKRRCP